MTIKEMEAQSGMDRANIRFYEREGLLVPKRMDNGYRDYSEDDLQTLLRIKLLRSLHISLDEIQALQAGSRDLADILAKQIKELEQEKSDVSYAQDVCRAIWEERADFASLDAAKYLEGIRRAAEESGSPYFTVKSDRLPQVFYPLRRFFARMFDFFIYEILWVAFLAFVFRINWTARSPLENLLDSYVAITIMLFLEPLWLRLLKTTPGKAILGLRLESADGKPLSYCEGLERTWGVIGAGLGYNIPIYTLVRLWKSYKVCRENEIQPWDESISYIIKDTKGYRGILCLSAYAAAFAVLLTIYSAQMLPPNRGDLTVAQFVENYNYYAKFLGADLGGEFLNEDGKWVEKEFDGTFYLGIGCNEKPEFSFRVENGSVKGVSLHVETDNNQDWIDSYDTQMMLSSLAFVGAQSEMGLFSKIPVRIAEQIEHSPFQDFSSEEAGVSLSCDMEYSGYTSTQAGLLIPEEDTSVNYFCFTYSMNIIP